MFNFQQYDLIIDARSPREYKEDHVPGAINLPVVFDEEYAIVGTLHRNDPMQAYQVGVSMSLRNIAKHLEDVISGMPRKSKILVYCFRGGKRSKLWHDALDTIGYRVEKLGGGWKGYRRMVNEELQTVPCQFHFNVLSGPTGCGKTRLLYQLEAAGAQVLDLEAVAVHRGSVLGAVPGSTQPSQKFFDSTLLKKLLSFTPDQPVWVEAESKKIGNVQLPDALLATMRAGKTFKIEASMPQRVLLWREDYKHFEDDPVAFVEKLEYLALLVSKKEIEYWRELGEQKRMPELFERVMEIHYDPAYKRSSLRNYPNIDNSPVIELSDLSEQGLLSVAKSLIESKGTQN